MITLLNQRTHQSILSQVTWPQKRRKDEERSTKETPEERKWPHQCQSLRVMLLVPHLLLYPALGKVMRSLRWTWALTRKLQLMPQGRFTLKTCCSWYVLIIDGSITVFYIFCTLDLGRLQFPPCVTLTPNYLQPDTIPVVTHYLMGNGKQVMGTYIE